MAQSTGVGDLILQFAQSFVAMNRQAEEMEYRRKRDEEDRAAQSRGFEIREANLKLREEAIANQQAAAQARAEFDEIKMGFEQLKLDAEKQKQSEEGQRIDKLGKGIDAASKEVKLLAGLQDDDDTDILLAMITGGAQAPKAKDENLQKRLNARLADLARLSNERDALLGLTTTPELQEDDTGTPFVPQEGPAERAPQPVAPQQAALNDSAAAATQYRNVAARMAKLAREGTPEAKAEYRRLDEERRALETQLRGAR